MERPEFILAFKPLLEHSELTYTDVIVYGYIHWLTKLKNEKCFASNDTLAKLAGKPVSTVRGSLAKLEKYGFITRLYSDENKFSREEIRPLLSFTGAGKPAVPYHSSQHPSADKPAQSKSIELEQDTAQSAEPIREEKDEESTTRGKPPTKSVKVAYDSLIRWAEAERGAPFLKTHIIKQYKALKLARQNKLKSADLRERWQEMASDKFWASKGYDWMDVVNNFNKKPV